MTIGYRVEETDVVAFHVHVIRTTIRFDAVVWVVTTAVAAGLFWIVAWGTGSAVAAAATGLGGGSAYRYSAPRLMEAMVARSVRKRLQRAPGDRLGDREMELTDHALIDRSKAGEATTVLAALRRIDRVAERAFIFIATDLAYIVPRRTVTGGDFDTFIEALQAATVAARN